MKLVCVRWIFAFASVAALAGLPARAQSAGAAWPTLDAQLAQDHVIPGSALDRLIRDHQDFSSLNPKEAGDTLGLPPWLRLVWRQGNPQWKYDPADPTGGYPHVLKEVRE